MVVSLLVVADKSEVPEVVEAHGAEQDVGVISLMVVANPRSDHSPESFHSWISAESRNFLWFSSYLTNTD